MLIMLLIMIGFTGAGSAPSPFFVMSTEVEKSLPLDSSLRSPEREMSRLRST
jgi:hypothetical protein